MHSRSGFRLLVVIAFAMSSLVVVAAPAAAETVLVSCRGTCGEWKVYDQETGGQFARCVYHTTAGPSGHHVIARIGVTPPLMKGHYAYQTDVSWRFKVQRLDYPVGPGSASIVYTSSWQTALADSSTWAHFTSRRWAVPAPPHPPQESFRVITEMRWWNLGTVEGFVRIRYDYYQLRRGTSYAVSHPSCGDVYDS